MKKVNPCRETITAGVRFLRNPGNKKTADISQRFIGAGDEARTRYLHLGKVALYQMSYARNSRLYYNRLPVFVNPDFCKNAPKYPRFRFGFSH